MNEAAAQKARIEARQPENEAKKISHAEPRCFDAERYVWVAILQSFVVDNTSYAKIQDGCSVAHSRHGHFWVANF